VLISFSFTITPAAQGVSLQPRDLAGSASVINSICFNFAQLLQLPQAQVSVANFTDIATGAVVAASQVPRVRRLAAAAGSLGVSVSVVVALGKTPTELQTVNLNAALSAAGSPAMVTLQASITQAVASNARGPASAFATGAPAAVSFIGSPFISSATVVSDSGSSNAAPAAGGAAAGGIVGAFLLACAFWSYRSFSKHGKLPCFRDRKSEILSRRNDAYEAAEVAKALSEAENALNASGPESPASAPVFRPARPASASKTAVVKRLVDVNAELAAREAKAAAEVAALKQQLAQAKKADDVDAGEVAELRRQLAAARAAAAAPEVRVANPAAFAPTSIP